MGHSSHHPEAYGPQSEDAWSEYMAEQAAADEEAELTYRRMLDDAHTYAEIAAADAEAEAAYQDLDDAEVLDTDIF